MRSSEKVDRGPLVFKFQVAPMYTKYIPNRSQQMVPELFSFSFYFSHFQIVYIQIVNIQPSFRNVRGALEKS